MIARFQYVMNTLEKNRGNDLNWAAIAIDSGYYDQSHFIADFKTFSGLTPKEYLSNRGEFLNYIPII